ncbi:DNA mismatch repair protein MutS [Cephaloticoccus capnophilus]|uniref:DNA mismatch repair protein MutS n=1 Tax=Cephaloticoccus capnophilus TaxID=1548208 RepID=A0A139SHL2_9BACT|nr:DNA mismatch repair protein MutS [Cephaloticoccus capnophilus]KXU34039.1 DNA mismatch repair protein MutS [Cephaloticoccus capnophilus]
MSDSKPAAKLTPMMEQYFEVKRGLPDGTLLLFRLGDFFELFYEDAVIASRLLGLTLTKRQDYPMAGLPYHAADSYITKLLAAGRKVALCDQSGPVQPGKLVKRALTRILTPGTTLAASQLDANRNHYLCALSHDKRGLHAAWLDLSTGEFRIASDTQIESLLPVLTALSPAELVLAEGIFSKWEAESQAHHDAGHADLRSLYHFCADHTRSEIPNYHFEPRAGAKTVMDTLGVLNLEGFGISPEHSALGPAGALLYYATETLRARPENLRTLKEYRSSGTLLLDPATLRNLEIFSSSRGTREGSLLDAINRTRSATGARLLERWLSAPTLELHEIHRRQVLVGEFAAQPSRLSALQDSLVQVRDIPRILGRLQNRLRNPRELAGIRDTLAQFPKIRAVLADWNSPSANSSSPEPKRLAAEYADRIAALPDLLALLSRALADELPGDVADGGMIRPGHDAELDRLRSLTTNNKTWLSALETTEQQRTGIKSLKVKFSNNFGYFIEVTKANLHLVPTDYIRRQTTVGGERYVTEKLREKEKEIFTAEERALAREQDLFHALVSSVLAEADALSRTADALAELDVLAGWAALAREWDYTRPTVDDSDQLLIEEGRHPVVEQMLKSPQAAASASASSSAAFVPNDTELCASGAQLALITGPNMAGKSTYIRQVALIALLGHIGCWVPAKSCRIGLIDRIFSRVGASDDLARGNSTFMVEMNETANILNNATRRSLIILDEIGRGTSTYDGLSIAWAVVEHLHSDPQAGPRTLFATHYQELTQLEKHLPRLRNLSVTVKEWNDEIVFVRRVQPGAADRSYGIQVARLAGLPLSVIDRAKEILSRLESDEAVVALPATTSAAAPHPAPSSPEPKLPPKPKKKLTVEPIDDPQLSLF